MENIFLDDKFTHQDPADLEHLKRALDRRELSGKAQIVTEYEHSLGQLFSSNHSVAVSSGTAALHAALFALNTTSKSEIIVSAIAPLPTVMPILSFGANPVFVDCESESFDFDIDDLRRAITNRTCAILVVHLWGYPTKMNDVLRLAAEYGVPVIEDAAQAHFATIQGKNVGTFADIGCFSTHDRKILSTGEGGFILTQKEELAQALRRYITIGGLTGRDYGVNLKLGALAAALGLGRIAPAKATLATRKSNAAKIRASLLNTSVSEIQYGPDVVPNYYAMVLRGAVHSSFSRFSNYLQENGVPSETRKYNVEPIFHKPIFSNWARVCPNAENLLTRILTVPVHPGIGADQMHYMLSCIQQGLRYSAA